MPVESQPEKQLHEGDDVRTSSVFAASAGLMLLVPVLMVLLWLLFQTWAGDRYAGLAKPVIAGHQDESGYVFPLPQLEVESGAQLREVRARENFELTNYGWADSSHKQVRIPIDRAMDLILERGLPVRGPNVNSVGKSEYEMVIERRLEEGRAAPKGDH